MFLKPRERFRKEELWSSIDSGGSDDKESICQYRGLGIDPWVGKISWRRKRKATALLLPRESHGQRSLVGYRPWGHKESDTTEVISLSKYWCSQTEVLEKTLETPLDSKEIESVNPKGNRPWIFIGRMDAEVEAPVLWPPDVKSWLIGKDPDAGKEWRREEKGETEDEMVGWHQRLNGHELQQTPSLFLCNLPSPDGPFFLSHAQFRQGSLWFFCSFSDFRCFTTRHVACLYSNCFSGGNSSMR